MSTSNPPRVTATVWTILSVVFLVATVVLFFADIGGWGYALMFFSLILFIVGVIVAIMYGSRAGKLTKLISPGGHLVHWIYAPEEWKEYAEEEFITQKAYNKILFIIIAVIALVCGIVVLIATRNEAGMWVMLSMLALIAVIGFVAWFTSWYNYRLNMSSPGEAYLGSEGIYLGRQLHLWNMHGAFLKSADYIEGNVRLLEFKYLAPARYGLQEYSVRVPVPRGKEKQAAELVTKLQKMLDKEADK
ncbi:MAG: hypothetical protein PHO26_00410 [Dehalococcoidia bacterium]|nr:hypothetical protein [Dehalococcoidia bacterium]MDD5493860.1 hypothetical protein [Dehalococcoidia bacterium]